MNKVLALVKFNYDKAVVLQDKVKFKYQKHGDLLIGMDETKTFVDCLYYEEPTTHLKAFGGNEFDLELEDGGTIHCSGQWWQGGAKRAEAVLNEKLVSVTYQDIESLKHCFVFTGHYAIESKLKELTDQYNGEVYNYFIYEQEVRKMNQSING